MSASRTTEISTTTRVIRYWLPVALMICIMFGFSTDTFSGESTQSLVVRAIEWLGFDANSWFALRMNFFVRKAAHFTEYAILAALLYRAFRSGRAPQWRAKWAAYSMIVIVVWALADEYHQSLTATRTGSIYDSFIDMTGGLFALIVIYRLRRNAQAKNARMLL